VTSEDFEDAEEGKAYSVEVTDGNGCVHFAETPEVEQLPPLSLELSSVSGACPGLSNGAVEVVANGGAPPYQFQWSNGANTTLGELNGLLAGSYSVTVTDDDECNSTLSFVIEGASLPAISVLEQAAPSCAGSTDGRIVIDVAPTAAYNIVWNNGTVGPEQDQVGAGAYTVSVSSASSCEASLTVMLEDPAPLQANVTAVTSASCANANDGTVALSVSGGVPPYTYEWSGGTTASSIITGLLPGGYEITVTDDNQCTTSLSAQVQTGNPPELNWVFANNVTCANGPDGALSVGVEGGNAGYDFEWWSPDYPQFTSTGLLATSLPAGTYCVEATHQVFGCTASGCYTLELEPAQSALPYLRQVEVSVARQDGTLLKIYSGTWVKGAGCYYYDADDNAVITDEAFNLINAGQPVAVEAKANVPLNSLSLLIDGAADIGLVPSGNGVEWINLDQALSQQLITGGIIDYTLRFEGEDQAGNGLLDMRALSEDLSLCTELPGLQGDCTWSPVPVQGVDDVHHLQKICFESNALQLSATSVSSGCDGSITVHTNAPGPSVITLSGAGTTTTLTVNQSMYLFSGLCQGVYTVTLLDDNGCEQEQTIEVGGCTVITGQPLLTPVSSCTQSDGSIAIPLEGLQGGEPPYSLQWSNGATGPLNDGLSVGSYSVTITDANGCASDFTFTIGQESPNGNTFMVEVIEVVDDVDNSCSGSITVDVFYSGSTVRLNLSGPGAPWQNIELHEPNWPDPVDQTYTFTGLCAGDYEIIASYTHGLLGCNLDLGATVESCPGFALNPGASLRKPSSCIIDDGMIEIPEPALSGGTPPFIWHWSNGSMHPGGISGLSTGVYSVSIVDANGCSIVEVFDLSLPSDALAAEITQVIQPSGTQEGGCDGRIKVTGAAGLTVELFELPGGLPVAYTVPASGVLNLEGLCIGDYRLVLSDDGKCEKEELISLTGCSGIQAPIYNVVNPSDCSASDGALYPVTAPEGGIAPYTQQLVLLDKNGSPTTIYYITTNHNGAAFHNLPEGTYIYIIQDSQGCTFREEIEIIGDNSPMFAIYDDQPFVVPECEGEMNGEILFYVALGSGPFNGFDISYQYNDGAWVDVQGAEGGLVTLDNLASGLYLFRIAVPGSECTLEELVYVWERPSEGELKLSETVPIVTEKSCPFQETGQVIVTVQGGNPPYRVTLLGPGGPSDFYFAETAMEGPEAYVATFTGLGPGGYTVYRVTDDCDRPIMPGVTANVGEYPEMVFSEQVESCCPGFSDLELTVTGGTPPFEYDWENGVTVPFLENVDAGEYEVKVTDSEGCYQERTFTVEDIGPPTVTIDALIGYACDYERNGEQVGNIGALQAIVSGGLPLNSSMNSEGCGINFGSTSETPYQFQWSTGDATELVSKLEAGSYSLSVTDGCGTHVSQASIQRETVVERPFGYLEGTDGSTCWNELNCGDNRLDVFWGNHHQINSNDMLGNNGECNLQIDCINGSVINIPPFYATESFFWDDFSECTCKRKETCTINQTWQDQISTILNGQVYAPSMPILLNYEDSGTFDEPATISNTGGVGESENCLSCERELTMECGDNPEPCPKCELDPGFFGDDADGDCILDDDDPCPNIGPGDCPNGVDFDPNTGCCNYCPDENGNNCPPNIEYDPSTGCCDLCPEEGEENCEDGEEFDPESGCCDSARPGGGKTAETQFLEGIDSSPSKNGKFAVYPAPFSSFLQLEYQDLGFENTGKVYISLLNSLGMRVYSHSYQEVFEQGTLSITSLSHLPSGIYWLEVAIEGQPPQLFKCIKQ
jgi:hypothetical protein